MPPDKTVFIFFSLLTVCCFSALHHHKFTPLSRVVSLKTHQFTSVSVICTLQNINSISTISVVWKEWEMKLKRRPTHTHTHTKEPSRCSMLSIWCQLVLFKSYSSSPRRDEVKASINFGWNEKGRATLHSHRYEDETKNLELSFRSDIFSFVCLFVSSSHDSILFRGNLSIFRFAVSELYCSIEMKEVKIDASTLAHKSPWVLDCGWGRKMNLFRRTHGTTSVRTPLNAILWISSVLDA